MSSFPACKCCIRQFCCQSNKMPRLLSIQKHFVASLGEFCGTFLFLFLAFGGTQTANIGGLFNPAVTLSLCITGIVPPLRSAFLLVSRIVGAIAAAAVVRYIIPAPKVMFNAQSAKGMTVAQGLFLEMFLTTELVFTILMLAAEKTKATFVAPVSIGLALFVAELAFAPNVVMGNFPDYHWIYWLGPILGSLLASRFYALIKYINYEEVNGDQDKVRDEEKTIGSPKNNYKGRNLSDWL
ncbi:aquaporin-1 [Rhexocercosporidium sp. MPI-PUGE-AT-0058]|nr:aquaporin-1 [Rhexocercosporidium sp. MPI-PUGE-AT-0058]